MLARLVEAFPPVVFIAGFLGCVLSATTGVGGALVLLPFVTAMFGANAAVALMAPVMLANNVIKALLYRPFIHRHALVRSLWGAIPGGVGGAFAASYVPAKILERVVAFVILVFIAYDLFFADRTKRPVTDRGLAPWGLATGFVSGVSGAAGPTNAIALAGYGLLRETFVGTAAAVSASIQLVKLPVFIGTGALRREHLWVALGLAAVALAAGFTGRGILRRLDDRRFRLALDAALAVLAASMLI